MKLSNKILSLLLALLVITTSITGCNISTNNIGSETLSDLIEETFVTTESASVPSQTESDEITTIPGTESESEIKTESASDTESETFVETETDVDLGIDFSTDPYENVSKEEFYANYRPAICYEDAVYRSKHYFMSGSIEAQDQKPTIAENQPRENGMLIRNTSAVYEDDGNTYVVYEADGDIAFRVYKGGAYVTLEEVAAYVYAFGNIPANYLGSKNTDPSDNPWGEYLRLNHSSFSGSTTKYPYEPELPNISGCGGELYYYEIDIGTTGTDCDPGYIARIYNDGDRITRGAARIVYARFDKNKNQIIDPNERYVFYTYNHYNDFQEYLNYEGGWGEMFGNVTGGGKISSKTDYNPTPYVEVVRRDITIKDNNISIYYFFDERRLLVALLANQI